MTIEELKEKYLKRLKALKENRTNSVDINTDTENELFDILIQLTAEVCQDLKNLQNNKGDNNVNTMKTINGKTFDEIFAQRGKKVKVEEMKERNVYLFVNNERSYDWLAIFAGLNDIFECPDSEIGMIHLLASDGYSYFIDNTDKTFVLSRKDNTSIHQATPDQIELLNLYIYHTIK